jgi:UDP-arabinose 4-epimerase
MNGNVLVTGGAGYIGSHACKALADADFCPVTIDNLCLGNREFVRWGPLITVDIRHVDAMADTIRSYQAVGVMHFAAFAQVGESVSDPLKYYENNVQGTLALLTAMRQTGLRKIVFSSSCAVYGSPSVTPISEQTPTQPVNPYGRSKLMCETILTDFVAAYGFERIALRYFNACGADPKAGIGESPGTATRLITRAILAMLGRVDDFVVNGSDFPTPDGTAVRDYIHVSDLADAHVVALRHLLDGHTGDCFNLGTGKGYSIKEVLNVIAQATNRSFTASTGPRRPGDPAELVADANLVRKKLGFAPKRSDIRTIVNDAWQWHTL